MAKERLSKLQKWILNRCLENKENGIIREEIRRFFGKKFGEKLKWYKDIIFDYQKEGKKLFDERGLDINDYEFFIARNGIGEKFNAYTPKKELFSTRSIEASISRSFNNLIRKEFITDRRIHFLTEKGFLRLTLLWKSKFVNTYKNYIDSINKGNEEKEKYYKKLVEDLGNIMTKN